jgi:hypothetical protein
LDTLEETEVICSIQWNLNNKPKEDDPKAKDWDCGAGAVDAVVKPMSNEPALREVPPRTASISACILVYRRTGFLI